MSAEDIIHQSSLELNLLELIDMAKDAARGRDEALARVNHLESVVKDMNKELERMKQDRVNERESFVSKERKMHEERSTNLLELERLKSNCEELQAKVKFLSSQNEELQVTIAQNIHHPHEKRNYTNNGTLSQLMTKETIEQLSSLHEALKSLESRVSVLAQNYSKVDQKSEEMAREVDSARVALEIAEKEICEVRKSFRESNLKSRRDQMTISGLKLDLENLQEQIDRLVEEVRFVNTQRRNLEAQLDKTKLSIATSLLPLISKEENETKNINGSSSSLEVKHDEGTRESFCPSNTNVLSLEFSSTAEFPDEITSESMKGEGISLSVT